MNLSVTPRRAVLLLVPPRAALETAMPWIVLTLLVVLDGVLQPVTLSLQYFGTVTITALPLVLIGMAQTTAIVSGGIDLSVAGVVALASALLATQGSHSVGSAMAWIVLSLLAGGMVGALNGVIIYRLNLQPFVVTLATWSILDGVALLILPEQGGAIPSSLTNGLNGDVAGVPTGILLLAVALFACVWARRTRMIRRIYAIGSDRSVANRAGVPIGRTCVVTYALAGALAAAGGIVLSIGTGSGDPLGGDPFVLASVAAVVIGGTPLTGGRGGAVGTVAGAFILTYLASVVFALNLPSFWTPLMQGVLLIVAVLLVRGRRP